MASPPDSKEEAIPGLLLILTATSPSRPTPESTTSSIQDLSHLNPTQGINYIPITTDPNTTNPFAHLTFYKISIPPTLISNPLSHISTSTNHNPTETRLYTLLTTTTTTNSPIKPSPILHLVSLTPDPTTLPTSELHAWYEEEHIPLFKHIPGWIRSRRGELISFSSINTSITSNTSTTTTTTTTTTTSSSGSGSGRGSLDRDEGRPPKWIAIHEWESMKSFETEEYKKAIGTEWRNSVIGRIERRERMLWRVSDGESSGDKEE